MSGLVGWRLVESAIVLLVVSFILFVLMSAMPGDPVDLMLSANPDMTAEDATNLRAIHGLDQPIFQRYVSWLSQAASFEFGASRLYPGSALQIILPRMNESLFLLGTGLFLAAAIAVPLGMYAAHYQGSGMDRLLNAVSFVTIAMPSFWLSLLLIVLFSVNLGWLPPGGIAERDDPALSHVSHAALPVATLVILSFGSLFRYVRASMIAALAMQHIRTARAKGASWLRIHLTHALRHAMTPIITVLALNLGSLLGGALVIETIFARPGMGKLIFDSIMGNDYNLATLALVVSTALVLMANLVADVICGIIDPRVTYDRDA